MSRAKLLESPVLTIVAGWNGCGKSTLTTGALAVIFDNLTEKGHVLVAVGHMGFMHWVEPVPEWAAFLRS